MPKEPQDLYGTAGSVPDPVRVDGSGAQPLSVRANPADFGAQIGAAATQLGNTGVQAGNDAINYATQLQGMVNESLATDTETQFTERLGEKTGKFKSLEGMDAVKSLPGYIADIQALRSSMRQNLPAGAARSFDLLALRHEGFAIGDANTYAGAQVRQADYNSAASSISNSINLAGMSGDNDAHFGGIVGDIKSQAVRMTSNTPGFSGQNPKTGEAVFDSTPEGQAAKTNYDNSVSHYIAQAWTNRFLPLMDQDVLSAYQKYQDQKGNIPAAAQVSLNAMFAPRVADQQARNVVSNSFSNTNNDYLKTVGTPQAVQENYGTSSNPDPNNIGNIKTSAASAVGTAGFVKYATPVEGVTGTANNLRNNYQGLTINQIASKWTGEPEKAADWAATVSRVSGLPANAVPNLNDPAVLNKIIPAMGTAEKNPQDLAAFTPDVVSAGVQKSLNGGQPVTSGGVAPATSALKPPSVADYYRTNYSNIIQDHLAQAEQMHPGDVHFSEMVRIKTEQHMNDVIRQQEMSYKVDADTAMAAANGSMSNGQKPTNIEQLEAVSPQVKQSLDNLRINLPYAYNAIENKVLTANSRGGNKQLAEYGDLGVQALRKIASGEIKDSRDLLSLYSGAGNENLDHFTTGALNEGLDLLKKNEQEPEDVKNLQSALDGVKGRFSVHFGTYSKTQDMQGKIAYNDSEPAMRKAWKDGIAKGISSNDLADPDNSNWIGLAAKGNWISPAQQKINALKADPTGLAATTANMSAFDMRQMYNKEIDPAKKEAIKQQIIKKFNLIDDAQGPLAPVSK